MVSSCGVSLEVLPTEPTLHSTGRDGERIPQNSRFDSKTTQRRERKPLSRFRSGTIPPLNNSTANLFFTPLFKFISLLREGAIKMDCVGESGGEEGVEEGGAVFLSSSHYSKWKQPRGRTSRSVICRSVTLALIRLNIRHSNKITADTTWKLNSDTNSHAAPS